jgi:16S rRNA (guanine966-N2)-methyltransferase
MIRNQVRIIGGQWRGRWLKVPVGTKARPTPDRVRETLFNWLSSIINGAWCLDAFAGTGVLGFEALSRGAARAVMVDQSPLTVELLCRQAETFKTQEAEIYRARVPDGLKKPEKLFDVVFLDPPYQENILLPTCFYLEEQGVLANKSYIYLETGNPLNQNDLPDHWQLIKSKKAGQVAYHLAMRLL